MKPGSLSHLVWGSVRSNLFTLALTVTLTAVSLGLSLSTLSLRTQARAAFMNGSGGYDAVLGAKGSSLQLVLNSLFHLETSPGNIPWTLYREVKDSAGIKRAYPIVVGDSFRGFRVIGTVPELLLDPPTNGVQPSFAQGRVFHPQRREAVVGSEVARRTNLTIGATFQPSHGLDQEGHSHAEEYLVVGLLNPTNTPTDRVLWIPLEGVLRMDGHVLRGKDTDYHPHPGEEIPLEHLEVSAVLIEFDGPQRGLRWSQKINSQEKNATLAYPVGREVAQVFNRLGWAHKLLSLFALVMIVVSGGAILASLVAGSELRRKDYALLRTLGLPRSKLFALLTLEGFFTTLGGTILSLPLSILFSLAASTWVRSATGVSLDVLTQSQEAPWLVLFTLALGCLAGAVPGWRVYHDELTEQLDPES